MGRKKDQDIPTAYFISHYWAKRPLDWRQHFGRDVPLDVEIGFGLGDFLIRMAQAHPERNFVGLEKDTMCVKRTLGKLDVLQRISGGQTRIRNVRVLQVPAEVALERLFAAHSIDRVYALFPCPWPKKKHIKYRTFSKQFLRLLNSRLVVGGELKIVTDHQMYYDWIRTQARYSGFKVETNLVKPKYETKYERKWYQAGQQDFYEMVFQKQRHIHVALKEDALVKDYFVARFEPTRFRIENATGKTAIIWKDFIFDAQKQKGMVHLVVAEENLSQHVWILLASHPRGWKISLAEGSALLPTQGVVRAMESVYKAAQKSTERKNPLAHTKV